MSIPFYAKSETNQGYIKNMEVVGFSDLNGINAFQMALYKTEEGKVAISSNRSGDYPYSRGVLLLRRDGVELDGSGRYRVACMNSGQKPLQIEADTLISSRGVKAYTEPARLEAGAEGDLIIECVEPAEEQSLRLYLKGLTLAPRERMIVLQKKSKE